MSAPTTSAFQATDLVNSWDLVAAAQDGDSDAFATLYRHYRPRVTRYLACRIHHRTTVDEFVSETFLRAWRRIDTVSDQGRDFGSWLNTIAHNIFLDYVKSSHYQREWLTWDVLKRADEGIDEVVDPEMQAIIAVEIIDLNHCIGQLAERERECIYLRYMQDRSNSEIAEVMKSTVPAVKTLRRRAVGKLTALLQERGY